MNLPYTLLLGDTLERMKEIPDGNVDLVLCDLPYGTTACKWDSVIPFDAIWAAYRRVLKPNGAAVLTCTQPFTSALITSNMRDFAYCWYWNKSKVTGFANAKKQPLRCVEEVAVFYRRPPTYNPQGLLPFDRVVNKGKTRGAAPSRAKPLETARGRYAAARTTFKNGRTTHGKSSKLPAKGKPNTPPKNPSP